MKGQVFLLALVACVATHVMAEPCSPSSGDTGTVVYFPHPTDCRKFYTCPWGSLVELSCPWATFWNDAIKACDLQGNVVCNSQPGFTTAESTTVESTTVESTTAGSTTAESTTAESTTAESTTAESTTAESTTAESTTAESTTVVSTTVVTSAESSTTESTNTESTTTEAPSTESTSTESATTTAELATTTNTTPYPSTNPSGQCPDNYDPNHQVYLPHSDCTKYYICTWGGVAVEQNCPPNLHWNQYLSYCDYPSQAGCSSVSTVSISPPQTPAPSGDCPPVYDPNHQVYFPHADCTKYYICTYGGNKLEQNCPPNLHWNQQVSYCDFPPQAGCSTTNSTPQSTSVAATSTTAASLLH